MGSYLSVCERSVPGHPEVPTSIDAKSPTAQCIVPTHSLVLTCYAVLFKEHQHTHMLSTDEVFLLSLKL